MERSLSSRLRDAALAADPAAALPNVVAAAATTPSAALQALAALQDGQFAVRQALALGLTPSAIRWLRTSGRVTCLRPGVARWVPTPGGPDPTVTAWLACWPWGTVSHGSAAARHELRPAPPTPEITIPHARTRRPAGVVVHRTRSLPRQDRVLVGAVPHASLARTVCDLATTHDRAATLRLVDDAVAAGASRRWLHARAAALTSGRDGIAAVRDATSATGAAEFRSWLERTAAARWRAADLPAPRWNVPVHDHRGRIGTVDALWDGPGPGVVAELEGLRFHTSPRQRRRDATRFNRLLAAGFRVRRFTWQDVVERPGEVAATLRRALGDPSR